MFLGCVIAVAVYASPQRIVNQTVVAKKQNIVQITQAVGDLNVLLSDATIDSINTLPELKTHYKKVMKLLQFTLQDYLQ